ncbi:M24 family metallopeptidase [Allostreptomyces psammosilenae]|uniref:Xaa-Pro aminopeptidase n=1 Tax=Allostreptomyces psammosilenae TaxID=1892865 RepID=A0A852ZUN6_9ACTN|nr:M24 family metallopeptidase [Allostreptomyces psammosilenae]NYI04990.1 Xaa-Pro aminopeptidase [Allostreptomyces psammosilenae]
MSEAHVERRLRLRERCAALGGSAALISHPANVRYLTGCAVPGAAVLVAGAGRDGTPGAVTLLAVPDRPWVGDEVRDEDVRRALRGQEIEVITARGADPDPVPLLAGRAATAGRRVGGPVSAERLLVEEHHLTVERHRAVGEAAAGRALGSLDRAVERLRATKDAEEIAAVTEAARIADRALAELLESILVGRTERHLAMELERRMADHGADADSRVVSVGSGPNSGLPGHRADQRRVEEGDFLTVELDAVHSGYHCAIARTFLVGAVPEDWQSRLYELVFAAQRAGREALLPGAGYGDVDAAVRRVLRETAPVAAHAAAGGVPGGPPEEPAGLGVAGAVDVTGVARAAGGSGPVAGEPVGRPGVPADRTAGPVGHGVGLENVEHPLIAPEAVGRLGPCMPVTVEPGVHIPGRGGVRIQDTLVVRPAEDGGPELLTITTKELLVL